MRLGVLFLFAAASAVCAQLDVTAIVAQSVRNYERDWKVGATQWTCRETDVMRSDGRDETDVSEVVPLDGTPYDKLISKDGHPLGGPAERKEERRFERAKKERDEESPEEREARIRKYENERAFVNDIPNAYTLRLIGEEAINGRPSWIVGFTPRPDFVPATPHGAMLRHIDGKLWIDKQDIQWAKAEAQVAQPISIGWILARIGRGAHFELEQTRVAGGVWLPRRIAVSGEALVLMVHAKPIDQEMTWSDCRKAPTASTARTNSAGNQPPNSSSFR